MSSVMPDAADPAKRLGVRLRPMPRSDREGIVYSRDHFTPPGPDGMEGNAATASSSVV
jgi:hypothetical protein